MLSLVACTPGAVLPAERFPKSLTFSAGKSLSSKHFSISSAPKALRALKAPAPRLQSSLRCPQCSAWPPGPRSWQRVRGAWAPPPRPPGHLQGLRRGAGPEASEIAPRGWSPRWGAEDRGWQRRRAPWQGQAWDQELRGRQSTASRQPETHGVTSLPRLWLAIKPLADMAMET